MNRNKDIKTHFKYTDKLNEIASEFAISEQTLETSDEIDDRHLIDDFSTNRRRLIGIGNTKVDRSNVSSTRD